MNEFSTRDVAALSGASLRQLQWWDEHKVVTAGHAGHRRYYSRVEAVEVMVIADLRNKGLSLQSIRHFLRFLHKNGTLIQQIFDGGDLYFLTDGRSTYLETDPHHVIEKTMRANSPMYVVGVGQKVERVKQGVPPPESHVWKKQLMGKRRVA